MSSEKRSFRRAVAIAWYLALAGAALLGGSAAAQQTPVATADKPAVVSVVPDNSEAAPKDGKARVTIEVISFDPPSSGSVQAVLRVADGNGDVVGRFGIFPNERFRAESPAAAQSFQFTLDPEAAERLSKAGKLMVDLKPLSGSGQGARLELGRAMRVN